MGLGVEGLWFKPVCVMAIVPWDKLLHICVPLYPRLYMLDSYSEDVNL